MERQESHIRIFDTTLRDGEQAPGCTMTRDEKVEVARQLARLGVDVIEAGFPAASRGDWESVHAVAAEVGTAEGPTICGLARASAADVDACLGAIAPAAKRRVHVFLATSDVHMEHKLRMTRAQVLDAVAAGVARARAGCDDVEFSPEDATRSEFAFLCEVLRAAIAHGATTLNIPDTVGYTTPEEYHALIAGLRGAVPGIDAVTLSVHCHDDLGMAVANSLAGVRAGARQVECTVNGIGERAGNASLEEVTMALHTRRQLFAASTRLVTRELARTSRLVSACTGVHVPPNKAVVGANAFAHEAGIHQDGVLKHRLTYEIMSAETVGLDGNSLVLGKHSGRHAFRRHLEALGYELADEELERVFARFKEIADRKKTVDDRDLEAIVHGEAWRAPERYTLAFAEVTCGTHTVPTATVHLRHEEGQILTASAGGSGPVDAVFQAVDRIVGSPGALVDFTVDAITEGRNAAGGVTVRVREPLDAEQTVSDGSVASGAVRPADGAAADAPAERALWDGRVPHATGWRMATGYGVHTDIIVAAAEAYVSALNKLHHTRRRQLLAPAAAPRRDRGSLATSELA